MRRAILVVTALLAACLSAGAGEGNLAKLEGELAAKAVGALKAGKLDGFRRNVESRLKEKLAAKGPLAKRVAELEVLEHYRNVGMLLGFDADEKTKGFLVWLLGQREFCSRFCHALAEGDSPRKAVDVLRRLKGVKGISEQQYLEHYEMAIAFALVWDEYKWHYWTRIKPPRGRMEELFVYYVKQGPRLLIAPSKLPHELLRFVVDHPCDAQEREFALRRYADRGVLARAFYDVKWTKRAGSVDMGRNTKIAYTLPNIKQGGGICFDQAYYGATVAKCVGLPAVLCCGVGRRGDHAWVGLLFGSERRGAWNLNVARYWRDRYWKCAVFDPALRTRKLSDGDVIMTGGVLKISKARREAAAARRNLAVWIWSGLPAPGRETVKIDGSTAALKPPAKLSAGEKKLVHDLLSSAVELDPFSRRTWSATGHAVASGAFDLTQVQGLSNRLFIGLGRTSPDFVCETIQLFIRTVQGVKDRDRLYNTCAQYFRNRPDLASEIKVVQGQMWSAEGESEKALNCYISALLSFPADGHVTRNAVAAISPTLAKMKDPVRAAKALKRIWTKVLSATPPNRRSRHHALWVIGEELIKYLKAAGMRRDLAKFEPAFRRVFPRK